MNNWKALFSQFEISLDQDFNNCSVRNINGGCINQTFVLENCHQRYFLKLNHAHLQEMFLSEMAGLKELAQTHTIKVPEPLICGIVENQAFLLMRYFEMGQTNKNAQYQLGEQLANLHRVSNEKYGLKNNNFIGSTPQKNDWKKDWIEFWRENRLGFQLKLAANNGYRGKLQQQGELLLIQLDKFFTNYKPVVSLVHGDLWSGNYAITQNGEPIIFDPAIYFGDRETDLAMTELFGGFSSDFYAGYQNAWALEKGYHTRKTLYNLYHVLNHLNLFGGGYLGQAQRMIDQLLAA
jgi:protein-ribulosamine 3-kinase